MGEVMQKSSESITLTQAQWEQMLADVERRAPEEACGLIAGRGREVQTVLPMTNALHSTVRYRLEPKEQLQAFQWIESQGWELVGIYHSHPKGPASPSPIDVAEAYYPEVLYLIWYREGKQWNCRAFSIRDGKVSEIPIIVVK